MSKPDPAADPSDRGEQPEQPGELLESWERRALSRSEELRFLDRAKKAVREARKMGQRIFFL
ncbi:MAG: hypothetical protein JW937_08540 [Candidatus Omnitrophica bacterium]|nr:hypothetical protein [Candidatus Omnitrophota bacterium]